MTNVGLVKQFLDELVNHKKLSAIETFVAKDMLEHEKFPDGIPSTRTGLIELFEILHRAFPDLCVVIEDTVIEGNKVVARQTWTGTHQADFFGKVASGKAIKFSSIDIIRIENSKITEHWGESNWLRLLEQLKTP
ncbi:MAG: ester cyclase [Trueperaceae bacterium]|nr:ester cyclase [Trueperaceae bacterium]